MAEDAQAEYYRRTAAGYDSLHIRPEDEHEVAARFVLSSIDLAGIRSLLDVGCGTGRGVGYFLAARPDLRVCGLEPSQAMIDEAVASKGIPPPAIIRGRGETMPFADASFDAVCEFGALHHAADPSAVVSEMLRVARRAVFISDTNRYGSGSYFARIAKLSLGAVGLWETANLIKTRGRGYRISKEDGISYSYSVYDALPAVKEWADRVFVIPTVPAGPGRWLHPLISSDHLLLCGLKDGQEA